MDCRRCGRSRGACRDQLGPGDEVITAPFTFIASANSIVYAGAKPVFVDIDPNSFNINVDLIAGLPHQSAESWQVSLDEVIASAVPHVSVYMLEIDEDSRLGRELIAGGTRYHAHLVPDEDLRLASAMRLPTFRTAGMTLLKRFTVVIDDGTVTHVFYPVFPPDQSAADVIAWLNAAGQTSPP